MGLYHITMTLRNSHSKSHMVSRPGHGNYVPMDVSLSPNTCSNWVVVSRAVCGVAPSSERFDPVYVFQFYFLVVKWSKVISVHEFVSLPIHSHSFVIFIIEEVWANDDLNWHCFPQSPLHWVALLRYNFFWHSIPVYLIVSDFISAY